MLKTASTDPIEAPEPLAKNAKDLWLLDPTIAFLNHGSFGAVPREVLRVQSAWRERIERRPIEMIDRRMNELMVPSHEAVGLFANVDPRSVGFVTNATGAINAVLRSMRFAPGELLVATNHVYNAIRKTMEWVARRDGAEYVEIPVTLPVSSAKELAERVITALPNGTRLLLIDEISSTTGIRFPLKEILPEARRRGIETVIDGAHAPGMIEVDIQNLIDLGAIAWTGNLHKWCFVPKGCAILHVCPELRERVQPTTISHFADQEFHEKFCWQGTADLTPWLCVPEALAFVEHRFGWDRLRAHNHALARWVQALLCDTWESEPLTPLDGSLLGSMASVRLPEVLTRKFADAHALQKVLYEEYRVEVPINEWGGGWIIRASCQVYNTPQEYEQLADAILSIVRS